MQTGTWQFELLRPLWLAALLLLPLLVYFWRRSLVRFPRGQRIASLVLRGLLVVLVVAAMTGVRLHWPEAPLSRLLVVFAIDRSGSITELASQQADAFVTEAQAKAGENPSVVLPFAATVDGQSDNQATDLAAAIGAGQGSAPPGLAPRVVLLSDGNATDGDALATATAGSVPIWTVPLSGPPEPEVWLAAIDAPGQVRLGEPFALEVVVRSNGAGQGSVRLLRDGEPVAEQAIEVGADEHRVRFSQRITDDSAATFTAQLHGFADTWSENNELSAHLFTLPEPKVLLVDPDPDSVNHLAEALTAEQIDCTVCSPERMPNELTQLLDYDLLVLSNVPATALPAERMRAIDRYVREFGGGLLVVGGDRTFTPGGYAGTLLEKTLPLKSFVRTDKPKPSLALVLVIDRSGSMRGDSIELARQATRQAVENLSPGDQVGVVAFEDKSRWTVPLQSAAEKGPLLESIGTINAGGGTNMHPAMQQAYLALRETYAELKHMIVLTDGISNPGDFDTLARDIAASGISVSTVGVGSEAADQLLRDIAALGGGNYYDCEDPADIPGIFIQETRSAGKVGISERPSRARAADESSLPAGATAEGLPTLLGHVETAPKHDAEVLLTTSDGDPLLARWRYGRGASLVFTSDIHRQWAAAWLVWDHFGPFWTSLARDTMRRQTNPGFQLDVRQHRAKAVVVFDAVDLEDRMVNGAEGRLEVELPGGKRTQMPLPQIAPGRYGATLKLAEPGVYGFTAALTDRQGKSYHRKHGLVTRYADEFRPRPTNTALLQAIAEATGGRSNPSADEVFTPSTHSAPATLRLWPYLVMAALVLLVIDTALKRVPFLGRQEQP